MSLSKEKGKELKISQRRLLEADGQPCPYCSGTMDRCNIKMMPTADHIRAKGRFPAPGSLNKTAQRKKGRTIIVCSECNFMKGTLTLEEFISNLAERNDRLRTSLYKNFVRQENIRYLLDMGLDRSEHE